MTICKIVASLLGPPSLREVLIQLHAYLIGSNLSLSNCYIIFVQISPVTVYLSQVCRTISTVYHVSADKNPLNHYSVFRGLLNPS